MNKTTVLVAVAALVLVGGFLVLRGGGQSTPASSADPAGSMEAKKMAPSDGSAVPIEGDGEMMAGGKMEETPGEKSFTVIGTDFAFDIKEMQVKKGDKVTVTFRNNSGFHDWVIDEFNAKTKQMQAGGEETITFVADKVGTFEYYCSVGKHRANGMVGKLVVAE